MTCINVNTITISLLDANISIDISYKLNTKYNIYFAELISNSYFLNAFLKYKL